MPPIPGAFTVPGFSAPATMQRLMLIYITAIDAYSGHYSVSITNLEILLGNWVDEEFSVPDGFKTDLFRLRMLTINDVVKDYDAVMTSREEIQGVFGPNSDWPGPDLTFEQDLIDLGWHQKEFQNRSSFAYTVMSLDNKVCLGCLYIYPTDRLEVDAMLLMWVRSDSSLDESLYAAVKQWIHTSWSFENVEYPGRSISWSEWMLEDE